MRIAVDATCWQNSRGYGRHARSLLHALVRRDRENEYTFFLDSDQNVDSLPPSVKVVFVSPKGEPTTLAASSSGHRSLGDMLRMSRALSRNEFDLLLFPTVYSYVPVFTRAKKLVMIHDVIAETYPRLTLPKLSARLFWKTKVALGRWQADAVVTVSEFSRQAIVRHFKMRPEAVGVVGEASDPTFRVLESPQLSERLLSLGVDPHARNIVYVGGFSPHKNLETLISVFARLVSEAQYKDLRLVMVGEYRKEVFHTYASTIIKQVEALGIEDRVLFTGYLPDEELVPLLNLATVCVLPSLIEGFGLPAIEAAACGCPVVATNVSPLPAVLGDGGIYFDPLQPNELHQALGRILQSRELRSSMRAAAVAAAGKLSWDAAAGQMMNVFEGVLPR
jgi:glycosyltransferase involved in cell wall biosynthesis